MISTNHYDLIRLDIDSGNCDYLTNAGYTINCLLPRTESEYWIGTMAGLVVYNDDEGYATLVDDSGVMALSNTNILTMLEDNEGNVWMGTFYGGLNLWHNRKTISPNYSIRVKKGPFTESWFMPWSPMIVAICG